MAPLGSLFTLPASWFHGATVWSAEQQDLAQQGAESTDARCALSEQRSIDLTSMGMHASCEFQAAVLHHKLLLFNIIASTHTASRQSTLHVSNNHNVRQCQCSLSSCRHTHADGALPQAPQQALQTAAGDTSKASTSANTSAVQGAGSTCITCGIGVHLPAFASATEQRAHFKTDWHRLNIKRRLARQLPLGEEAFHAMLATQAAARSTAEGHASEVRLRKGNRSTKSIPPPGSFLPQRLAEKHW